MTDIPDLNAAAPEAGQARSILFRRLLDIVAMPSSSLPPQDRSMAGDILLDMLFHAKQEERQICADRLKLTREAPRRIMRYLAQCAFPIAKPLLEENESFDASDLRELVENTTPEHRLAIARRKQVCSSVCDKLIEFGEPHIIRAMLENRNSNISESAMDTLVTFSRKHDDLCNFMVQRPELKPAQAMAMFWWADGPTRRIVLQRQAADRSEMIERCADIFRMAAQENWSDPVSRKTLQLIERRQRNRAAIEKSQFESLEEAIKAAAMEGMTSFLAQEIGYLSGVKPVTIAKIMSDVGGEGLAVLCKATGLKRPYLRELWTALKRPMELEEGVVHPQFAYVAETYELLSVGKAQTTLRYWNWSLSSSFSPKALKAGEEGDEAANDERQYSTSQRTARLVFGQ